MNSDHDNSVDPAADQALRVAVERVVRPVVATESRKLTMRRELYSHALEAYRAAVEAGGSVEDAAGEAKRRLGDPAALTAELQAGVPWSSRREARFDQWIRRRPEAPAWRHAVRLGLVAGGLFLAFLLVVVFSVESLGWGNVGDRVAVWFSLWLAQLFTLGVGLCVYVGGRVRDTIAESGLTGRSVGRIAAVSGAGFAALLVTGFGMLAAMLSWSVGLSQIPRALAELPPQFVWSWTALCLVVAVAAAPVAWLDVRERRGLSEWLSLDLG